MRKLIVLITGFLFSVSTVLASEKVIHVFLVGPGLIGKECLRQMNQNFGPGQNVEMRIVGLADSHSMIFSPGGLSVKNWREQLSKSQETMSLPAFVEQMIKSQLPNSVFVDCTSNQAIADAYPIILESKISIVTPNKKANSGSFSYYSLLKDLTKKNHVSFLYDANVGAGLPFIRTIQSIKRSGDSIFKIEAILSGTLSYLFNTFDGATPFSEVLREAQKKGYTEPDPRDDLNGQDMARKFLILAREAGYNLEMKDIVVEKFLPSSCFEAPSVEEFYQKLRDFDKELLLLAREAKQKGEVLRFIGTLENGHATLSLKAVKSDHPFYQLSDTNNIASITSQYYSKNPIVIKGPGAGASVTAASVLSNIVEAGSKR